MAVESWSPGGGPGAEGAVALRVIRGGATPRPLAVSGGQRVVVPRRGGGSLEWRLGTGLGEGRGVAQCRRPDHPGWARALAGQPAADERLWVGVGGVGWGRWSGLPS